MKKFLLAGLVGLPSPLAMAQTAESAVFTRFVCPEYPRSAQVRRVEGQVLLELEINKSGIPTYVHVIEGDPMLGAAATAAARQWRIRPYLLNNTPVEQSMRVWIKFTVHGGPHHHCQREQPRMFVQDRTPEKIHIQ